ASTGTGSNAKVQSSTGTGTLVVGNNDASSTFGGILQNGAGTLALTKTGAGTLTLSGANTYTGNTTVNQGKLVTTTSSTGGGAYSVADGATLDVLLGSAGATLNVSSMTVGTSTGSTLTFEAGVNALSSALITASGAVTANGTTTINISGASS